MGPRKTRGRSTDTTTVAALQFTDNDKMGRVSAVDTGAIRSLRCGTW